MPLQKPRAENVHDSGKRPDDKPGSTIGNGNQDAIDRRNAIADAADETRKEDLVDIEDVPRETPVEEPEVTAAPDTNKIPDDTQVIEEPVKIKVPVNGKMVEMTQDELIASAAKVASADEYLRLSKESVESAARLALSPTGDETDTEETDFRALAKALQIGTEEEAEQALRKLAQAKPSKTPDVSQLVDERLTLREEKAKFEEEYKDVWEDPQLRKLVIERDKELYAEDKNSIDLVRWRKAAGDIREWKKGYLKVDDSPQSKAARKAQVAPVPTASGRKVEPAEDEGEDNPATVIAEMAKARKQERPVRH